MIDHNANLVRSNAVRDFGHIKSTVDRSLSHLNHIHFLSLISDTYI